MTQLFAQRGALSSDMQERLRWPAQSAQCRELSSYPTFCSVPRAKQRPDFCSAPRAQHAQEKTASSDMLPGRAPLLSTFRGEPDGMV
jgi:hypothetical protein